MYVCSKTVFIQELQLNKDLSNDEIRDALIDLGEPAGILPISMRTAISDLQKEAKLVMLKPNEKKYDLNASQFETLLLSTSF